MEDLKERLRSPRKWVSIIEGNAYINNKAPYEAAHRIDVLESGLSLIVEKSTDPYAVRIAAYVLEGKGLEDEGDIQGDDQESSGPDVSLPKAG